MTAWLVSRLTADFVLRRLRMTSALIGADLVTSLVAATVSQANLGHLIRDPELARRWGTADHPSPPELRRPISAYAVAAALGLPRETVRRKIKALVAIGFIEETPEGFVLRDERTADAVALRVLTELTELSARFGADLIEAGVRVPNPRDGEPTGPTRVRVVSLATTAFMLRFFEDLNGVAPDQLGGLTYVALTLANTRHLDWRSDPSPFRGGLPPLALRRPVTALALAAELGMPRETTRRQVRRLVDLGHAQLQAGGVIVDPSGLPRPELERFVARAETNARRLLADLRSAGVVFKA